MSVNCANIQDSTRGTRYLIRRPKALQWFHHKDPNQRDLIHDSEEERQAGRFELFLDLLYVALVANFSDDLAEHPDGVHLLKYFLIFTPAWHIWADLREIMNSYYTDDIVQRIIILWVMALLVLYANNANLADEDLGALRTAVGAYVCARFTTCCVFLISSFASYQHRTQARILSVCMIIGLMLTIPLFLESISLSGKVANIVVVIVWSEASWAITLSPYLKTKLKLTYSTAVDIAHEVDRMAAFFIIILGEFVYSTIVGNPAGVGLGHGYSKAVATLIIAFCLNWIYITGDGSLQATHPIRRSGWTAFAFFLLHLPLSASFLIGGHICAVSVHLREFEQGQRWLLGGGLGVGMFCLWVFAMLFKSEDDGQLIMPRWLRVGMRLVVAVILIALPATHDHLDTTSFLMTVMALFAIVTLWETVGGLLKGAQLYESWEGRHPPKEERIDSESQNAGLTGFEH